MSLNKSERQDFRYVSIRAISVQKGILAFYIKSRENVGSVQSLSKFVSYTMYSVYTSAAFGVHSTDYSPYSPLFTTPSIKNINALAPLKCVPPNPRRPIARKGAQGCHKTPIFKFPHIFLIRLIFVRISLHGKKLAVEANALIDIAGTNNFS